MSQAPNLLRRTSTRLHKGVKAFGKSLCLALLSGLAAVSCRPDKADTGWREQSFSMDGDIPASTSDSASFILDKAMQRNIRFNTFSANMDIKLKVDAMKIGMKGQLRIENGETLWMLFHKMSIELLRLKITPDSLWMYSKIGGMASCYTDDSTTRLIPVVFRLCQGVLMQQTDTLMFSGKRILAQSPKGDWILNGVSTDSLAWKAVISKDSYQLEKIELALREKGREIQAGILYSKDGMIELHMALEKKTLLHAEISYEKIRWDTPLTFPFSIPASTQVTVNHGLLRNMQTLENEYILPE